MQTLLIARRTVELLIKLLAVGVELLLAHGAGEVEGVELFLVEVEHLSVNGLLAAGTHVLVPLGLCMETKGGRSDEEKE